MKPTTETLERIRGNSTANRDRIFMNLYRYMLRPDIYYVAYSKLYANKGAATKGANEDTADGFSESKVMDIIKSLRNESYQPMPVRRTYIPKKSDPTKKRPLGLPTFTDKLVQEVLRMIIEAIYEPIFLDTSHEFRPKRSCHTALTSLKKEFGGARWFIEGDIKACFDSIDHEVLIGLLNNKIKDVRIINLIRKFLKAGYLEDWKYHKTYSGTPQGGIISPLLANVYLHEIDKFVRKLKAEFDTPKTEKWTAEYRSIRNEMQRISSRIERTDISDLAGRSRLIKEYQSKRKQLLKTPCAPQIDKKIKYIRYADDFLIGVKGSREDCVWIKSKLAEFIGETLKMKLSDEKTLITHSSQSARFLGYDVRVRRNATVKRGAAGLVKKRTLNNLTELLVPHDRIRNFLFSKGIAIQKMDGAIVPVHRGSLLRLTDLEIISVYNAELRGICNYYGIASNFICLNHFAYLMEYSCLKTLAAKHNSKISKIIAMFKDGKGNWGIPYETKNGPKRRYFVKYSESKRNSNPADIINNELYIHQGSCTTLESRLKAKICELCGTTESSQYEIHHVNKVKNLKGKERWEKVMIAKRRKTLVVCNNCHYKIHHQ
jgi:group II intron reverse transcriptase/maturase